MRTGKSGSQACSPRGSCANQEEVRTTDAQGLVRWEAGEAAGGLAAEGPASHVKGLGFILQVVWSNQRVVKVGVVIRFLF